MTEWRNRITVDPEVLVGKPIIRGTRISVELLLDRLGTAGVSSRSSTPIHG